jgi:hypothetical protein
MENKKRIENRDIAHIPGAFFFSDLKCDGEKFVKDN